MDLEVGEGRRRLLLRVGWEDEEFVRSLEV